VTQQPIKQIHPVPSPRGATSYDRDTVIIGDYAVITRPLSDTPSRLRTFRKTRVVALSISHSGERLLNEPAGERQGREESEMTRNRALWIVQVMLAIVFAGAGAMKFITPVEVLSVVSPFPAEFIRFIGVCEVLGAVGLIFPYALRILPVLTSLAATGLVVIMIGATVTTLAIGGGVMALPTVILGLLAALVAYGRRPQDLHTSTTRPVLQPAH
jgi:hypothetical protein